jgi:NDP-sugar pyrophosphorylase family protein
MQVAILAGGLGTRLRPVTEKIPKPMVPVAGKPFLHWQLRDLKQQGYTNVLLLVAYLGEQVEAHFGDGSAIGMKLRYAYEPEPLGTGGALRNAVDSLENEFILINGDSFLAAPLDQMTAAFGKSGCDAMVSVYDNRDRVPVIPNLKASGGIVTGYLKDADASLGYDKIDSGIYVMKRALVEQRPAGKFALADLWPALIERKKLGSFDVPTRFFDIGTPERLIEFENEVLRWYEERV